MSTKPRLGLDGFDLFIHLAVTACIFGAMAAAGAEEELFGLLAISLIVLAIRRRVALGRSAREPAELDARLEYLEQRVADLEAGQDRMMELEERLDFAERLLARSPEAPRLGNGT